MRPLMKIAAVALLFAGAINFLNAQIGLGVRGGVNFATAELEDKAEGNWENRPTEYIPRLDLGLIAEIPVAGKFAVQGEVNMTQKGYKTRMENGTVYDARTLFSYIEVPVLLKGKFGAENLKLNVMAGPAFGYAFDGTVKTDAGKTKVDFDRDQIRKTEWSAIIGLGLGYKAGPGALILDLRMNWGISNLNNAADTDIFHWHNRGFGISAGYIFSINQ